MQCNCTSQYFGGLNVTDRHKIKERENRLVQLITDENFVERHNEKAERGNFF